MEEYRWLIDAALIALGVVTTVMLVASLIWTSCSIREMHSTPSKDWDEFTGYGNLVVYGAGSLLWASVTVTCFYIALY